MDSHALELIWLMRRSPSRDWRAIALEGERLGSFAPLVQQELFPPELEPIALEIAKWRHQGIEVLTVLDFPPNLRAIPNRPPLIFVQGRLLPHDDGGVAVIGTRHPTPEGQARSRRLARELAEAGVTVFSGLARGIDTAAHLGALEGGGRTLAVIGTGLQHVYPPENRDLQRHLSRSCAVVSQFWPEAGPRRSSFPIRNVTMSGLSRATIVVEAGATSGARNQAEAAVRHGRTVFLMASLLERHEWARKFMEHPFARLCSSTGDVLEFLTKPSP
jgi:DNA processing protein